MAHQLLSTATLGAAKLLPPPRKPALVFSTTVENSLKWSATHH